jgi:aarF domain-containing kinase
VQSFRVLNFARCSFHADTRSLPERQATFHTLRLAMGKQILVDGLFNGDPHPGNFLVTPDGGVGLIDLGQVCLSLSVSRSWLLTVCFVFVGQTHQ